MRTAELVGPASRSPPVPHPSVHLSTRPSPIRLSVHTPTRYLPTHLSPTDAHTPTPSTSLPIHLSVHLCVHPSVYPPVHPLFLPSFHPPVLPMSVGPPQCIVGAQLSRGRCTRGCRGGCGRVVCSGSAAAPGGLRAACPKTVGPLHGRGRTWLRAGDPGRGVWARRGRLAVGGWAELGPTPQTHCFLGPATASPPLLGGPGQWTSGPQGPPWPEAGGGAGCDGSVRRGSSSVFCFC